MADTAAPMDGAFHFIFWFSVVFAVLVIAVTLLFIQKYRRQKSDQRSGKAEKGAPTPSRNKLEILWTVVPTLFIIVLFHVGFSAYIHNVTAAEGATEIRVFAKKWSWEFEYGGGARSPDLHLEVNKPYKLILSSEDVIHSFFIPEFRVKRDAVPGQYSFVAFTPTAVGEAHVFCAEYCGTNHSAMLAKVFVEEPAKHEEFLASFGRKPKLCGTPPVECTEEKWGESLFTEKACFTCHGTGGDGKLGGSPSPGPKLAGIFGHDQPLQDGSTVHVDENYVRESILKPNAKIVAGYANVQMPPFAGSFTDDQLEAVIAYIKSLK